ncbi:MAG TPA: ATP-binding protein [Blastocatellia bacterium]|nr:ATP-binding protein [Blastocatellia bacterium]
MFHSLRFRLNFVMVLVLVIAVGAIAFFYNQRTRVEFQRFVTSKSDSESDLSPAGDILVEHFNRAGSWEGVEDVLKRVGLIAGKRLILVDDRGGIAATTGPELSGAVIEPSGENSVAIRWAESRRVESPEDSSVRLVENDERVILGPAQVRLTGRTGNAIGTLYLLPSDSPESMRNQALFVSSLNRTLLLGVLAIIALALTVTFALSRRILAPVEALTGAVRRMANGELDQKIEARSRDEIGDLTRSFNSMADSLTRLERLRRNLVNDVAHELRTPLTNIRCHLETVQDGLAAPDAEFIASLHEEVMLLGRIVDDLQELALAESNQLRLERRPISIKDEIEQAINTFHPRALALGIDLRFDGSNPLPQVYADPGRIAQILRNLLSNAVTHTPPGGLIEVSARAFDSAVEVIVSDTGPGISQEHLPNIFERFYRTDISRERATGGAGLGLPIVKQLVLAQGGNIRAESEVGIGSTFAFSLPIHTE